MWRDSLDKFIEDSVCSPIVKYIFIYVIIYWLLYLYIIILIIYNRSVLINKKMLFIIKYMIYPDSISLDNCEVMH